MANHKSPRPEAEVGAEIAKTREDYMSKLQTLRALSNVGFDELFAESIAVPRNIVAIRGVLEQLMRIGTHLQDLEEEWLHAKPEI